MMDEVKITYDLRARHNHKKHFSINDIHYSIQQNDPKMNVAKAIIIEKQPKYPLYTGKGYDAAYYFGSAFVNLISQVATGGKLDAGKVGNSAFAQFVKNEANSLQNTAISDLSGKEKASSYYKSPESLNKIKNLFEVDNEYVCSYELPFLSDYFMEADGTSGWEVNGIESMIGKFSEITNYLNIGYPVTPNWKYESKRLTTKFEFNLINDTTENLTRNLRLIMAMLPGMMHVLINGQAVSSTLTGFVGAAKKTGNETLAEVAEKIVGDMTTMYKSPNVYEVVVPGRFRWLWCSMNMNVSYSGKIYNDTVNIGDPNCKVFTGNPSLIGFPEVFKISIGVESLLPQSFNEFYNFMADNVFHSGEKTK